MSNQTQCSQCGRPISEVDRAGGSCPWCGRVLTSPYGPGAKPTRHRHTPVARTPSRSSSTSSGSSGWSYWWLFIVALAAMRGVTSCNRMETRRERESLPSWRQSYRPTEVDRQRVQEMYQQIEQDEMRWQQLQADDDPDNDSDIVRPGEAARRLFGISSGDDANNSFDSPEVSDALRRQREAPDRSNFGRTSDDDPRLPTTRMRVSPDPVPRPQLPYENRYTPPSTPRPPSPPRPTFPSPSPQRSFP